MNLNIEYLIRSKAVRDFMSFPCSLLFKHRTEQDKVVITLALAKADPNYVVCKRWQLYDPDYKALPTPYAFKVLRSSIFEDERIYLPNSGYELFGYRERPVDVSLNDPHHPMDLLEYETFVEDYLNCMTHRILRRNWLWDAFKTKFYPNKFEPSNLSESYTRRLEKYEVWSVEAHQPNNGLWGTWQEWKRVLLLNKSRPAATELIFASCDGTLVEHISQ